MKVRPIQIVIDAADVDALRAFWVAATGYVSYGRAEQYRSAIPAGGTAGPKLVFQEVDDPRSGVKNRLHLDLVVGDDLHDEAERLVALGATRVSDEVVEAGTGWIVMADPEGNEFCLVRD